MIGFVAIFVGVSLASSASAALIRVEPATETFPAVISVEGEIAFGDERDFVNQALGLDSAIVVLASPGGNTFAAIEIGKAIRLKNFVTLVDNNEECASACALIWLAGVVRFMGPEAQIGFHASYEVTPEGEAHVQGAANALVGGYLTTLGYSQVQILRFTDADPESMTWMSPSDFRDIGIDVRVLEPSEEQTVPDEAAPSTPASPPQPAPEPTPLFAIKGWVAVDIKTGGASFPGYVIRLVDRDQHLSGHIFVGCAPQSVGPYLEFELKDLKQELAGITQAHLPIWIDEVQLDAAVSEASVFLLMDQSNVAKIEEMSNRLLNPGPQTLLIRVSPAASFIITLYDWTSDYARRYEQASGDAFLRMSVFTSACASQTAAAGPSIQETGTPPATPSEESLGQSSSPMGSRALVLDGPYGNDSGCAVVAQSRAAMTGMQDDMVIVNGRSIKALESGCQLPALPTGDGAPMLANCSGEGEEWTLAVSFLEVGDSVIYRDSDGAAVTMHRCDSGRTGLSPRPSLAPGDAPERSDNQTLPNGTVVKVR